MIGPVAQNPPRLVVRAELPAKIVHLLMSLAAIALVGISGELLLTVALFIIIVALIAEGIRTVRLSAIRRALQERDFQMCPNCGAVPGKDRRTTTCAKCNASLPTENPRDWWRNAIDP